MPYANQEENNKLSDKKHNRPVTEEFAIDDVIELSKKQGHICGRCNQVMNIRNVGNIKEDWTLDRHDESLGHEKGNCFLSHWDCNEMKLGDFW